MMPLRLNSAVSVVSPTGARERSRRLAKNSDGTLRSTMQEVLKGYVGLQVRAESTKDEDLTEQLRNIPLAEAALKGRRRNKVSTLIYEYNRLCKTANFLPNPMSRLLYDEMKRRQVEKGEVIAKVTSCSSEHERNKEPPCLAYYSPKPSQVFLGRVQQRLTTDGDKSKRRRNNYKPWPLATVCIHLNREVALEDALHHMKRYGDMEEVSRIGERSYLVLFRDLVGACRMVQSSHPRFIYAFWYHRELTRRQFGMREGQPLHVVTDNFL